MEGWSFSGRFRGAKLWRALKVMWLEESEIYGILDTKELFAGWRDAFSQWSSGDDTRSRVVNCVADQKKRYSNQKGCLERLSQMVNIEVC